METKEDFRFPPRRILVPMDLTPVSLGAWEDAKGLALRFDASLDAVYVNEWIPYGTDHPDTAVRPKLSRDARQEMRRRLGSDARIHVLTGDLPWGIFSWSGSRGFDLMVIGTHRRRGIRRVLVGSVAETLVRNSPIPVLVLGRKPRTVRSILVPVNFHAFPIRFVSSDRARPASQCATPAIPA